MHRIMRLGAIAAVAAALTAFGGPALAETTTVMTNSTSVLPESQGYVKVQCPSTIPYPVTIRASSSVKDSYNSQYLNYKEIAVAGREVKVNFTNSQSKRDAHSVNIPVKVEVLCSDVPHEPPTGLELMQRADIAPGVDAAVTVSCPPAYPHVTRYEERHSTGVDVVDVQQNGPTYFVGYQNTDFLHTASATLYVTCSA
ncbi:hypothetical protein [Microbispora sp. GKU 823]|uniref:hypothetical protein n=1 Tax=Microbispora sp. GKU 823 TaxID=1652100 RepID=UPI0009A36929|nr:hypothetical protein [Microbispora sp. GKU 823]OPG10906.1 hypothetical protein B1L11_22300 [Microbispora sp. GKU 823]